MGVADSWVEVETGAVRPVGVAPERRLAGRAAEEELLARVIRGAVEEAPRAVVVHGEAGVGKTRLLREVTADDPDLTVLWGTCVHFGSASVPFAPIIGVLQDWMDSSDPAEQAEVLVDVEELSTLLPALGGRRISAADRLIPLIDLVLNRIALRRRTVVVVDDLHWADMASLDVLAYLITGLHGQQLTLLGTCRDEDRGDGHPLHGWLADMRRMPSFEEVHLDRLAPDATAIQLEHLLGRIPDIDLVTQVQARSDGNPYLTELLVRDLSGTESTLPKTVPAALREALLAAWHGLSWQARQLVRVLAVGGRPTPLATLTAVAAEHGFDVAELSSCVTAAQEHGVLRPGPADPLWFRHPLLAEVLYDGLPAGEAALIHATYLRVLESHSGQVEAVAADLAVHSQQAGRIDDTYRWSRLAAERAARLRAPAEQAIQLERMCKLWNQVSVDLRGTTHDRTELVLQTSAVCVRVGRGETAIDLLTEALNLVDRRHDPLAASNLLVDRSILRWHQTEPIAAVLADIQEALKLTEPYPDSAERARVLSELGSVESWSGHPAATTHADEAVRIARAAGSDRALAEALAERSSVLAIEFPLRALADAREAEPIARACGSTLDLLDAMVWQVHALRGLGRREEATEVALRGYAEIVAPGRDLFAYFLAYLAADGLMETGQWQKAQELLRIALAARCRHIAGGAIRLTAASLAVRFGKVPEARQHLDRALELISDTFAGIRESLARGGAEVLVAEGRPEEALSWLGARLTGPGAPPTEEDDYLLVDYAHAAAEAARAARDTGDQDGVARFVSAVENVVADWPWEPFATARLDSTYQAMNRALFLAELARCRDDPDQTERWRLAIDTCQQARVPWHLAVAQWRCAEAAIAAGQPPVSVGELLRRANRGAIELGAIPLQDDITSLARRARITLREPVPVAVPLRADTPLSTLTAREQEVLGLLVAGRSNGEIAKELVISDKTVSAHVSNILRKTGTTSRMQAAALAERLDGLGR